MKRGNGLRILTLIIIISYCLILVGCDLNGFFSNRTSKQPDIETTQNTILNTPTDANGVSNADVDTTKHTHKYGEWKIVEGSDCSGLYTRQKSCPCGDIVTETINSAPIGHNYVDGICTKCKNQIYEIRDNYVYLGSYPQTLVTDASLCNRLLSMVGSTPTTDNKGNWTDYGYKKEYRADKYSTTVLFFPLSMYYADITLDGKKYRGVYFDEFRNHLNEHSTYKKKKVYWFAYEPIRWRIINKTNDTMFLLCDTIIDGQEIQVEYTPCITTTGQISPYKLNTSEGTPANIFINNYQYSYIRHWLNNTFLNAAFSLDEQTALVTTNVSNDLNSAITSKRLYEGEFDPDRNNFYYDGYLEDEEISFLSPNTKDKLFLLSMQEATAGEFGISTRADNLRERIPSDYAKSQGVNWGSWWLRSPMGIGTEEVDTYGVIFQDLYLDEVTGVVPALVLSRACKGTILP